MPPKRAGHYGRLMFIRGLGQKEVWLRNQRIKDMCYRPVLEALAGVHAAAAVEGSAPLLPAAGGDPSSAKFESKPVQRFKRYNSCDTAVLPTLYM